MNAWRAVRGLLLLPVLVAPLSAAGAEPEAAPGEGRELFVSHCSICHSIDYVEMHAPFATRALWEAEVTKMRTAFKAPIRDEDARQIVDYLARSYGAAPEPGAAKPSTVLHGEVPRR